MSILDILLLVAVAFCVWLAIRTLKRSGGGCHCGTGACGGNCAGCNKCENKKKGSI